MSFTNAHHFYIENFSAEEAADHVDRFTFQKLLQEACLGGGHQSKERFDTPRCHPETRAAVIRDIMSWVDSKVGKEHILWMSGPAGAGKSSIAQTICEQCHEEGKLIASFFFSRSAARTGRDDGDRLVPTMACQMSIAIPETRDLIVNELKKDPAVLSYAMDIQMEKLVLRPLSQIYATMDQSKILPHLAVIDGLDECNDPQIQSSIIAMIARVFPHTDLRLRFLIASRPELEIRNTFGLTFVSSICAPQIVLNWKYSPSDDIRVYLQSELASLKREHTLKTILLEDSNWPTSEDIDVLVRRSSGQFIYASTVMKFLMHPRRDPRDALRYIVGSSPEAFILPRESPFAQIDALYTQVLKDATSKLQDQKDSIIIVLQLLLFRRKSRNYKLSCMFPMASFISMRRSELELLLADLHSIIHVPSDRHGNLEFHHASFGDFLQDSGRSGEFYINKEEAHVALAHRCFVNLSTYKPAECLTDAAEYSCNHYFSHIEGSRFSDVLLNELHYAPNLQRILDLIMQHNETSFREFGVFFNFHYHKGRLCTTPKNENIKSICDRMADIIDDLILSSYPSVDDAARPLINAIIEFNCPQHPSFEENTSLHRRWLGTLLEIPERGKHLYLDSSNSMHLYTRFCSPLEFRKYCTEVWWNPTVLKYLLERIEPSADINPDAFRDMSKEISDDAKIMFMREYEVKDFLKSVDEFIQRCVEMAQNGSLEQTDIEEQAGYNLEQPAVQGHLKRIS